MSSPALVRLRGPLLGGRNLACSVWQRGTAPAPGSAFGHRPPLPTGARASGPKRHLQGAVEDLEELVDAYRDRLGAACSPGKDQSPTAFEAVAAELHVSPLGQSPES